MNRRTFLALFFLCTAVSLFGFGKKEKDTAGPQSGEASFVNGSLEEAPVVQVTGIVRLVGNAPFSELVISGVGAQWYLMGEEAAKLMDMQHRTVTVEGAETVIELKFAGGQPAGKRRELRDIKIIAIE